MWSSMSLSTSLSSSILGLANTAKPTLRSASTHGRTTSALPDAMLVKTVASGSSVTCGSSSARAADRSAVWASSQRPSASNRGRCAAVGLPPRMEPRPMSRLGASQTRSTRSGAGTGAARRLGDLAKSVDLFGHAHGAFSQRNSVTALPTCWAFASYFVTGRRTEIGSSSASSDTRRSSGSASPTSAICSAYPA